ncbi:zinc-binding dehydrogenase [Cryobacterium sp. Sr8]|uniref:zinc-binding dehydrogenase n=1 Tax=Cryobacterium sp. Sr8 TaxID=1259203 RepID=UPI00141ABD3F|nr:zinc-binding dehydrogenase [Cryobacterium sp. Sr8]
MLVISDLKGILLASRHSAKSGKLVTAGNVAYTAEALAFLVGLAEAGRLHSVIDRSYDLADIAPAHRFVDTGRKKGSVVLRLANG